VFLVYTGITEKKDSKKADGANTLTMKKYPLNVNFVHLRANQQSLMISVVGHLVVKPSGL